MKVVLVALLVAAVSAVPIPEDSNGPVEMIVNGVPEGQALEIGDIVGIKLNEHTDGAVVATDLLHPFTGVGIAEANLAAAAIQEKPGTINLQQSELSESVHLPAPVAPVVEEPELPESIHLPAPVPPVVEDSELPESVHLPAPAPPAVEVPEPIELPQPPAPEVIPDPIVLPPAVAPEVVEDVPVPAAQDSELYNDGVVSVSFNGPEDPGMLSTLSSWFNMVLNYFNQDGNTTSDQIV